jgi:hypothetical protein
MTDAHERDELHPLHLALFLIGGLCTGTGILNLYWSFGCPDADLNGNFKIIGFSGIDNIAVLPTADLAIPLLVVGVACLVMGNATAWKETDGY